MFLQLLVLNDVGKYDFLDEENAARVAVSDISMVKIEYDFTPEVSEDVSTILLLN